jgi:hypothetical protein
LTRGKGKMWHLGLTSDGITLPPFHANLLQAAVSTNAPIQALAVSFHDEASGQMSQAPTYVGDATLVSSRWRTLMSPHRGPPALWRAAARPGAGSQSLVGGLAGGDRAVVVAMN